MSTPFVRRLWIAALVLATFGACSDEAPEPATGSRSAAPRTLEVRGIVRQLPASAGVPLLIEHEAIPGFVDINGEAAPMDSMTMPFEVAGASLLAGIAVGDKIVFDLAIDWSASPPIVVTDVARLPEETVLRLGEP